MGTRSYIVKSLDDGTFKAVYCHWDGYPDHNGKILRDHYASEAKIDDLLALGDVSTLGEEIGEQHDFDDRSTIVGNWCTAYGRDRGEEGVEAAIHQTLKEAIDRGTDGMGAEWVYVWNKEEKEWRVAYGDGEVLDPPKSLSEWI